MKGQLEGNPGQIADEDEDQEYGALSLDHFRFYGFDHGERPTASETKQHHDFEYFRRILHGDLLEIGFRVPYGCPCGWLQ
jgi:hypothetical protein